MHIMHNILYVLAWSHLLTLLMPPVAQHDKRVTKTFTHIPMKKEKNIQSKP